jgi:hypothetical protein
VACTLRRIASNQIRGQTDQADLVGATGRSGGKAGQGRANAAVVDRRRAESAALFGSRCVTKARARAAATQGKEEGGEDSDGCKAR